MLEPRSQFSRLSHRCSSHLTTSCVLLFLAQPRGNTYEDGSSNNMPVEMHESTGAVTFVGSCSFCSWLTLEPRVLSTSFFLLLLA